jgi:hypothetical protein
MNIIFIIPWLNKTDDSLTNKKFKQTCKQKQKHIHN